MPITALNKVSPSWYTPESEKKEKKPTRFKLKPLTPPEMESIYTATEMGLGIPPANYGQVLKMGIVDWENFLDENGRDIKCKWTEHHRIPGDLRFELAMEVIDRSQISGDESGN